MSSSEGQPEPAYEIKARRVTFLAFAVFFTLIAVLVTYEFLFVGSIHTLEFQNIEAIILLAFLWLLPVSLVWTGLTGKGFQFYEDFVRLNERKGPRDVPYSRIELGPLIQFRNPTMRGQDEMSIKLSSTFRISELDDYSGKIRLLDRRIRNRRIGKTGGTLYDWLKPKTHSSSTYEI